MDAMEANLETEGIVVRRLRPADLEPVIALDAKILGRRREEFYKLKLKAALAETETTRVSTPPPGSASIWIWKRPERAKGAR